MLQGIFQVGEDKLPALSAILERYGAPDAAERGEDAPRRRQAQAGILRSELSGDTLRTEGDEHVEGSSRVRGGGGAMTTTTTLTVERRLVYIDDGHSTTDSATSSSMPQPPRRVRSVCRVNNANMPVKALRALGQLLVDFNGQGAAASLAHEGAQMDLLDDWAGTADERRRFDDLAVVLAARRAEVGRCKLNA